jgi:acyl dehydratase
VTTATILEDGYMPRPPLTVDQYRQRCGEELGRSHWITVDQLTIDAFAALTGDHQAIHLDRQQAIAAGYPSTIAHGFLVADRRARAADHPPTSRQRHGTERRLRPGARGGTRSEWFQDPGRVPPPARRRPTR